MFRVTDKPINLQELVDCVTDPKAGAIATFIGTTRNNNEGRKVIGIDYEAYPEMAEKELARIGEDTKKNWPICRMANSHRLRSGLICHDLGSFALSAALRDPALGARRCST